MNRRHRGMLAVVAVLALAAPACGDDGGSNGDDAVEPAAADEGDAGSDGDTVEIPQAEAPDEDGDGISDVFPVPGTPVDLGQTALLSQLEVTVSEIESGDDGLIEVSMRVENVGELDDSVPDTYTVCPTDDTLAGVATEDGDLVPLEPLPPGESAEGVVTVESLPDCPTPLLQVRVISLEGGFDHIAEWEVPAAG